MDGGRVGGWGGGNKQTKATKSLKHVPQQLAFAKLLMDNICILRERDDELMLNVLRCHLTY